MTTIESPTRADTLHIRRATPADEAAILELVRMSLGDRPIHRTHDFWRWKHEANPFGRSPTLLAEDGPRLVGLRTFMRWTWHCDATAISAVRAVDTATHTDYRGRGIFKRLTLQLRDEVRDEGAAFVYNTPNSQSRPGYLKMGWTLVGRPTVWIRPVHPTRLLGVLRRDVPGMESVALDIEAPRAAEVLQGPAFEALIDAAASSPKSPAAYHTPLSPDYLRWRYADIPGYTYHAAVEGQGADGALVIGRARSRGTVRELRLCEIVVGSTPAARANARRLLRRAGRLADVDMVIAMPAGRSDVRRALVAAGFLPVPRSGPILTTFPLANETRDPRRLKNWALSIGDLELF